MLARTTLTALLVLAMLGPASRSGSAVATTPGPLADRGASSERLAKVSTLHIRLESSVPADGDSVSALETIRLVFNRSVNPSLSQVRLVGPDGTGRTLPVELGEAPEILVAATPALAAGSYLVEWRVVSADGHPVSGEFAFQVTAPAEADLVVAEQAPPGGDLAADAAAGQAEAAEASGGAGAEPDQEEAGEGVSTALSIWRGLATSSLMALAGLLAFLVWIKPEPSPRTIRLARVLAVIAPILLAIHVGAWIRSTAPPGGLDLPWIRAVLGGSGSGRAESTRFLCALAALIALWRRHEGTAAILTLTAVGVSGAIGHALAVERMLSVPARSAHLLASAIWFGGLLVLVTAEKGRPEFLPHVRRISAVALASVIVIAFTGLVQSIILLPNPAGLVTTVYGRVVLAKVGGLLVLMAFGAANRKYFMPRLAEGGGAAALQRSATFETWVMVAVILLAGFLSYLPIPE